VYGSAGDEFASVLEAIKHGAERAAPALRSQLSLIQHVAFEVKPDQLDASIEFYELLGFRRVTAPKELAGFVTWLERDGDQFHLIRLPETSHLNAGHAAVPLGDHYEATKTRLRDAGHQVDDQEELWGSPRSFARDPAGNLVELMKFGPPPQL
jgi:catechol 2,3-dioxygenase-like lactoylglutathione lyase family enzyme